MWMFARSAVRAHVSSYVGTFVVVVAAAALLSATGVLLETGLRDDLPLLTTVASSFAGTAILVVVLVVASTFAAALRQRQAQFALLRTVGATTAQVRSMITAEVTIVFALAAPVGAIPGLFAATLLTPVLVSAGVMPAGVVLGIGVGPVIGSILLLYPTALLSARLAARSVTAASPAGAVRGTVTESSHPSRLRLILALCALAAGLLVACVPLVVRGTLGSATGATSAFLLITAAALLGPALLTGLARRASRGRSAARVGPLFLAVANTRGFSHRRAAAIIPLALVLTLGAVQTGVNGIMADAAAAQLREGVNAEVVITSDAGVTLAQRAALEATPGIGQVVASSTWPVSAKVDDDDFGGLSWETANLRVVDGAVTALIDPRVTSGSLDHLAEPFTVAVGSDTLVATGKGVGDTIELRFGDQEAMTSRIVAVYDRGLGFGDYLVAQDAYPSLSADTAADLLFATGAADTPPLGGLTQTSVDRWAADSAAAASSEQNLGVILLFALIGFIAIAAANTLAMLTAARRAEFSLLRRIGATRRQLLAMVAIESVVVAVSALIVGTLCVLPALAGAGFGMLGNLAVRLDGAVFGGLVAVIVVVAFAAVLAPALRLLRDERVERVEQEGEGERPRVDRHPEKDRATPLWSGVDGRRI